MSQKPLVGVIMGSASDWPCMQKACQILEELEIPYEKHVMSAHRTPELCHQWTSQASERGIKVIIAAAGMAAHLAGVVAASTLLPVLGVPMKSSLMGGLDSLLSMVQMPSGIPVATTAVGDAGAKNAALMAARILSLTDPDIQARMKSWHEAMVQQATDQTPWQ